MVFQARNDVVTVSWTSKRAICPRDPGSPNVRGLSGWGVKNHLQNTKYSKSSMKPFSEGDWILRAGDSSRDFLIPDRWRAPLQPFKSSRELTIPKKGHQQNCCCPVFFWFSIRKGSWRHERSGDEVSTHHNCFPTMCFFGGFPTGLRE